MKLIDGARHAWRLWSVRVSALGAIVSAAALAAPDALLSLWNAMPDDVRLVVPDHLGRLLSFGLFLATIVARVIRQGRAPDAE